MTVHRRRPNADLPRAHIPWDMPDNRALAKPLLGYAGPRLARDILRRPPPNDESQYRAIRRLAGQGYLVTASTLDRRRLVELAPGEDIRLREALRGAAKRATGARQTPVPDSQPGDQRGLMIVRATVTPDLVSLFARALEQQADRPGLLGAVRTIDSGHEYLLVATNDPPGRSAELVEALQAAGVKCSRFSLSPGMDREALRAHARTLRN